MKGILGGAGGSSTDCVYFFTKSASTLPPPWQIDWVRKITSPEWWGFIYFIDFRRARSLADMRERYPFAQNPSKRP